MLMLSYSAHKSSAADALLAERSRIDSSHRMTDEVLECVPFDQILSDCPTKFSPGKHMRLALNLHVKGPLWQA